MNIKRPSAVLLSFFFLLQIVSYPIYAEDNVEPPLPEKVSELSKTAWSLVVIQSMNDTELYPNEGAVYSIEFAADGRFIIQADCNRGTTQWQSEVEGQLQISEIAATRALCAPESIDQSFLKQLTWVRSYVLKDGHLFLATMADGSIMEFKPITNVEPTQ